MFPLFFHSFIHSFMLLLFSPSIHKQNPMQAFYARPAAYSIFTDDEDEIIVDAGFRYRSE